MYLFAKMPNELRSLRTYVIGYVSDFKFTMLIKYNMLLGRGVFNVTFLHTWMVMHIDWSALNVWLHPRRSYTWTIGW